MASNLSLIISCLARICVNLCTQNQSYLQACDNILTCGLLAVRPYDVSTIEINMVPYKYTYTAFCSFPHLQVWALVIYLK